MKQLSFPSDCIFFVAILATDQQLYQSAENQLIKNYGPPIHRLPPAIFTHSAYYETEMGPGLLKGFLSFRSPFHPGMLAKRKRETRKVEWDLGSYDPQGFKRSVNIDPGYVSLFHVALATSKNFSHRFYLEDGVFAEVTLLYHPGGWEELAWTYPDYKLPEVQQFLSQCRSTLKSCLNPLTS